MSPRTVADRPGRAVQARRERSRCLCAELHGLVLLHNDRDFETVARVTGQRTRRL